MNPTIVLILCILPAALFVLWPLFAGDEAPAEQGEDIDPLAELEQAKNNAYAAIKEAEFDRRTGKLDDADYESLVRRYKDQALHAIAALEAHRGKAAAASPQAIRFCPQCGTKTVPAANFCAGCGTPLAA